MTTSHVDSTRLSRGEIVDLIVPPAPLFAQQQQVLTTLVVEWDGMTADEKKRMLAAIFDSVTASAEGG